jgi:hypothetical protein
VRLGGVGTLRVSTTTGNCYPNYFMLVSASGINLSATSSGNNLTLAFPTQTGASYRIFYRTDLTTGGWILLSTLLGDGTVQQVTDSLTAGDRRFYKVTSP